MASQTETQSSTELKLTDSVAGLDAAFMRLGLAVVLLLHSLQRFGLGPYEPLPLSGFAGFLGSLGVPAPGITAWVVTLVELVGALLLLVGLFTRAAAAAVAVVLFVALALVHWPAGFAEDGTSIELLIVSVFTALALVVRGAGRFSLEEGLIGADQSLGLRALARLT